MGGAAGWRRRVGWRPQQSGRKKKWLTTRSEPLSRQANSRRAGFEYSSPPLSYSIRQDAPKTQSRTSNLGARGRVEVTGKNVSGVAHGREKVLTTARWPQRTHAPPGKATVAPPPDRPLRTKRLPPEVANHHVAEPHSRAAKPPPSSRGTARSAETPKRRSCPG